MPKAKLNPVVFLTASTTPTPTPTPTGMVEAYAEMFEDAVEEVTELLWTLIGQLEALTVEQFQDNARAAYGPVRSQGRAVLVRVDDDAVIIFADLSSTRPEDTSLRSLLESRNLSDFDNLDLVELYRRPRYVFDCLLTSPVGGVLLYNEENRVVSSMSYHTRETIRQCVRAWAQSRDG